jgi:hypothetical protein
MPIEKDQVIREIMGKYWHAKQDDCPKKAQAPCTRLRIPNVSGSRRRIAWLGRAGSCIRCTGSSGHRNESPNPRNKIKNANCHYLYRVR